MNRVRVAAVSAEAAVILDEFAVVAVVVSAAVVVVHIVVVDGPVVVGTVVVGAVVVGLEVVVDGGSVVVGLGVVVASGDVVVVDPACVSCRVFSAIPSSILLWDSASSRSAYFPIIKRGKLNRLGCFIHSLCSFIYHWVKIVEPHGLK